jgi:hypothetical protein
MLRNFQIGISGAIATLIAGAMTTGALAVLDGGDRKSAIFFAAFAVIFLLIAGIDAQRRR